MISKVLIIDLDKCGGCRTCELICSWSYQPGVVRPSRSRIHVLRIEQWGISVPIVCQHCEKPICKDACPVDAISRNAETGAIIINPEVCVGCKACLMVCPYGAIGLDGEKEMMIKCDLCNGAPKCVQWCPREAIRYEKPEIAATSRQWSIMEERLAKPLIEARKILIERKAT